MARIAASLRPHLLEYNRHREVAALFVRDQIGIDDEHRSRQPGQRFDFRSATTIFARSKSVCSARFSSTMPPSPSLCFCCGCGMSGRRNARSDRGRRDDRACATTRWPGRLEVIQRDPLTVIDVGHTPDAIRQSLASLTAIYGAEGWILVVGISLDKNAEEIVSALAPCFDTIICTAAHHKGADAESIAARRARPIRKPTFISPRPSRTPLASSQALAASRNRKIYVAGGLFAGHRIRDHRPWRPRRRI